MKKVSLLALAASLLVAAAPASADWFGDRWGGNGYNDWPVWTPMYWMEEMADSVDNNGWRGGRGYAPAPYGYGAPAPMPYGYGAPAPMPYGYGAPAPMPYGYGAPAPMPYGYGAPAMPVPAK